ncbi:MAG: hypothetical protein WAX04_04330 [Oscillospiraceae bacterium]
MLLMKKRKKLVFSVVSISFIAMLLFTIFFNHVDYEISSTFKLEGNILLTTSGIITTNEKNFNTIDLKLNQLDDKSAMEYVQNNKNFFDEVNMVDYQQVIFNLNSKEFTNSEINSYSFKLYLADRNIITGFEQVNIVEQNEALTIRVTSDTAKKTKEIYDNIIACMPTYIEDRIKQKVATANTALKNSITSDQNQADRLINQYAALKKNTGLADIVNLNKGIGILNSLSSLSHDINVNSSVANKFERLLSNEIAPELVIKNADFSGLKLTKTLISYTIIEIIASILIGFLAVFIAECYTKSKKIIK